MNEPKTFECTCGKEIIVLNGSYVTDLCKICPLKLKDFFIRFRKTHPNYGEFVHIRARDQGDAVRMFYREWPSGFGKLNKHRESIPPGYTQRGKTLEYRYTRDQLEDKYPPGHPKRKKRPRKK